MTPSEPDSGRPLVPCGPWCRYARVLAGFNGDWLWCECPAVSQRVVREGTECSHFRPNEAPSLPAIDDARPR